MGTALVTGASAGLGAAFASVLAARGDDLVLVARDAARLETAASELRRRHNVEVEVLAADLADRTDLDRIARRLQDAGRPVDLLVNNAGFGITSSLLDSDTSEHERALDVMCRTVLVLCAAAGRAMRERGRGRIINVASLAAWMTTGDYSAVKAYTRVYSEALSNELRGTGVTVTALCPGWVRTEFHERAGIRTATIPGWIWVDAERVARDSLADAAAGRVVSIPTRRWKLARFALDLLPRSAVRSLSRILARSRKS